jgi:hypothetical protein
MVMNFSHIITGDKTWVSFVIIESKEQTEQLMHTHSPNKLKKFKCLPEADSHCFLGQESSADGGINATGDLNNVRSVL